ncbi:hypothetical protein GGR54DRAFT_639165 [Hypoxylon sp. NC1633]|nr:hypothetical protein GGR54DRAFT_639165 [Hypoxylon sp. NC1633]
MATNKKRLYLAVYPSSGTSCSSEVRYHLAFLIGPKAGGTSAVAGTRYHVKIRPGQGWKFIEDTLSDVQSSVRLLARIVIAKITDRSRLVDIFRSTVIVQNDLRFDCRTWIIDALQNIRLDGNVVGTAELNWENIEHRAHRYVAEKTEAGRYEQGQDMTRPKPTWDMLDRKEIIP